MSRINVLQFTVTNSRSGVNQYILNNWRFINQDKFHFDFVTFSPKLEFEDQLKAGGSQLYYIKNRAEENLYQFRREINQIFAAKPIDAVHIHTGYWKSFEIEKLAKENHIPKVIIHAHNSAVFDDQDREVKTQKHLKLRNMLTEDLATDFWACSKLAAKWLYGDRIPLNKIKIMDNAIDVSKFTYNQEIRRIYRKKLGWEHEYIIGHVGRFSYQKNHQFLIEVFKEAAAQKNNLRLLLIGIGPLEDEIKALVLANGLGEKIYFAGARDDVNNWMQAMDCLCLPSHFEGLPIVAIEAQASGLPCYISSAITSEVKILESLQMIELCKEKWVKKLVNEPREINRQAGSRILEESNYNIVKQIKVLEQAYENLL